jgi:hypothetical protein
MELQNSFADHRFAAGREFLACASDSSGESSPPELLQLLLLTLLYQRIQRNRYQTWRPFLAWGPS